MKKNRWCLLSILILLLTSCTQEEQQAAEAAILELKEPDQSKPFVIPLDEAKIAQFFKDMPDPAPGFIKHIIGFSAVKGNGPYECLFKRLYSNTSNQFVKADFIFSENQIEEARANNTYLAQLITSRFFLPGEKCCVKIVSKSDQVEEEVSFIPRPIQVLDANNNLALVAELKALDPVVYEISILNFDPNADYTFSSLSQNETMSSTHKGISKISYSPNVIGYKGGIGYFSVEKTGEEKLTLELPWGDELFYYGKGTK
jgi:hypothetical protein